jgi:CBS domain-containing protein
MPRGGKRPNAGRRRGSKGKATIEKAIIAERDLAEAKASGRKLGKEVLDHYMHVFAEIADTERAAALAEKPEYASEHEARFERFARYAIDCAHKLAPYQSPTFRAFVVAPPPSQGQVQKVTRFTLRIFDPKRPDEPRIIEHEPPVPLNAAE